MRKKVIDYTLEALAWVCIGWFILMLLMLAVKVVSSAYAQHAGHDEYHSAYEKWKQPGKDVSCCSGREVDWSESGLPGRVKGDCYPTEFRVNPNKNPKAYWIAKLDRYDQWRSGGQEWIEVPDSKLVREINPDDSGRSGHLCTGVALEVLCYVTPTGSL